MATALQLESCLNTSKCKGAGAHRVVVNDSPDRMFSCHAKRTLYYTLKDSDDRVTQCKRGGIGRFEVITSYDRHHLAMHVRRCSASRVTIPQP